MMLYHYSLNKSTSLKLSENSAMLKFTKRNVNSFPKKALYVTTELFVDSGRAHQMLSITYHPQYNATIDISKIPHLKTIDNTGKELDLDNIAIKDIPRVWPAFGKTGGSHECLITPPNDKNGYTVNTHDVKELANGGTVDEWHQDAVENYDYAFAEAIARGIIEALETLDLLHTEEYYSAKVIDNGVVINSLFRDKYVTVSAAWKNLNASPEFKFWACLWNDDKNRSVRTVLPPFSETITVNICPLLLLNGVDVREYLKSNLQNKGNVYSILTEKIKVLLKRLTGVSDKFYDFHSHEIIIPP